MTREITEVLSGCDSHYMIFVEIKSKKKLIGVGFYKGIPGLNSIFYMIVIVSYPWKIRRKCRFLTFGSH